MKKVLIILATSLFFMACKTEKNNFTIDGTISSDMFNGTTIELKELEGLDFKGESLAKVEIKDSKFTIKGNVDTTKFVAVIIDDKPSIYVFLEKSNFSLYIDVENYENCHTKGSPLNDAFTDFSNTMNTHSKKLASIYSRLMDAEDGENRDNLQKEYDEKQSEIKSYYHEQVNKNQNLMGALVFANGVINHVFTHDEASELYSKFNNDLKSSMFLKDIADPISRLKEPETESDSE